MTLALAEDVRLILANHQTLPEDRPKLRTVSLWTDLRQELKWDSLDVMEAVMLIEEKFNVEIKDEWIGENYISLVSLSNLIMRARNSRLQ